VGVVSLHVTVGHYAWTPGALAVVIWYMGNSVGHGNTVRGIPV